MSTQVKLLAERIQSLSRRTLAGTLVLLLVFLCFILQYSSPGCCSGHAGHQLTINISSAPGKGAHGSNLTTGKHVSNTTSGILGHNLTGVERKYLSSDYLLGREIMRKKALQTTVVPVTRAVQEPVQCRLLIDGDRLEAKRIREKLTGETKLTDVYDYGILETTSDCAVYRDTVGFYDEPQSDEERNFPLAFTIRMHERVTMVEKILSTLYHPQNIYCIHVDKKSQPVVHQAMARIANCLDNVFVTSKNIEFIYSSFSAVEADMICMEELLNSGVQWKYLLNLAGSEFPLKTNLEMVKVLKLLNGTNDIEQVPWSGRFNRRINSSAEISHDQNLALPSQTPKAPFYKNITLKKGCAYNAFSRAFVQWALADELAREFINWTRDTIAPDETVWSTLNNLPGAPGGYHVDVSQTSKTFLSRDIIWQWSAAYCWEQRFVRGICILSSPDLFSLSQRWELFANKFDLTHDHYVVDCLGEWLRNRTQRPDPEKYIHRDIITTFPHVKMARAKGGRSRNIPFTQPLS